MFSPFVIRNIRQHTSDKANCFNWNLDYLRNNCAQNEVIVRTEANKEDYRTGVRVPIHKMKFDSCKLFILVF